MENQENKIKENYSDLIPCFLCGNGCFVKQTKNKKPHFICDPCGVQVFIRREKGIILFNYLVKNLNHSAIINLEGNNAPYELIGLINNLIRLKEKVKEIEEKKSIFGALFSDQKGLDLIQEALMKEIKAIENKLNRK